VGVDRVGGRLLLQLLTTNHEPVSEGRHATYAHDSELSRDHLTAEQVESGAAFLGGARVWPRDVGGA
jgi:hypothetical protein